MLYKNQSVKIKLGWYFITNLHLRWPTAKSLNNIGICKGVNHPKNKFEIAISDKEFKDWGKRFIEVLKSI